MLLLQGQWSKAYKDYDWSQNFFRAIRHRHPDTVAAFLDASQRVDGRMYDTYYPTTLMEAIIARDLRTVDLLLHRGADISRKYKRRSAITEALTHYGKDATLTQTLLDRGASIGLEEAIVTGDLALAEQLLTNGADPEMQDDNGETLLIWAAFQGKADAVRLLVRFGANPNTYGKYSRSPLAGFAATGNIDLMKFLIEHGANLDTAITRWQLTPLAAAAGSGQNEAIRWLIDKFGLGADQGATALGAAAANNRLEVVRMLLNAGVDVNASTHYYFTRPALTWAAWDGNVAIVQLLLHHGADVHATEIPGRPGRTALSFAADAGRKRVIPLLLSRGIPSEQKDKALLGALQGEHSDTAELLLQGGADPNATLSHHQTTPLMLASKRGKISTVQLLLEKGAATDAVDRSGKTALDWAEQAGRDDIAALLRQQVPPPREP